ncbi:MAG: hypothetical protein IJR46_03325 [Neisseriaceae bacterium]|nr:hypothetical protein [Neisseriaceae bacterium]
MGSKHQAVCYFPTLHASRRFHNIFNNIFRLPERNACKTYSCHPLLKFREKSLDKISTFNASSYNTSLVNHAFCKAFLLHYPAT